MSLPATHHKGKLLALRLLCTLIVRPQDIPLPRNQLLIFYRSLHLGLTGQNQVKLFKYLLRISDLNMRLRQETINIIIKYCGMRFFSLQLPGFLLLMLDFLHGANSIISSTELKGVLPYFTNLSFLNKRLVNYFFLLLRVPELKRSR